LEITFVICSDAAMNVEAISYFSFLQLLLKAYLPSVKNQPTVACILVSLSLHFMDSNALEVLMNFIILSFLMHVVP